MVNPQQVSSYIRKPYALDKEAEVQLREIIKEYPYFNNAWLLLARCLHNQNNPKFQETLKQASMYGGNRALLYKLVNVDAGEADEEKAATTLEHQEVALTATPFETKEKQIPETTSNKTEEPAKEIENTSNKEFEQEFEQLEEIVDTGTSEKEIEAEKLQNEVEQTANEIESGKEDEEDIGSNEAAKVKSAYEKILGNPTENTEDSENNEFEIFDINETVTEQEPELPSFDDEDDFVLQIDNSSNADTMADTTVEKPDTKIENVEESKANTSNNEAENDQEEIAFKLNNREPIVGEKQVETTPAIAEITEDEELKEPAIAKNDTNNIETTENTQEHINEPRNEEESKVNTSNNEAENDQEEIAFKLNNREPIVEEKQEEAIPAIAEITEDEELKEPAIAKNDTNNIETTENTQEHINEPRNEEESKADTTNNEAENDQEEIAFKLNNREPIVEEKQEEATPAEEGNNLVASSTFFEWLTYLKNPEIEASDKIQKKNEIGKHSVQSETEKEVIPPSVQQTATSVNDIIERFIKVNPSISRAKAEFYNPEVKSRESDAERDDLATETLAKIYTEQNLNDKAIEIYKRLIKVYPSKKAEYKAAIAQINKN